MSERINFISGRSGFLGKHLAQELGESQTVAHDNWHRLPSVLRHMKPTHLYHLQAYGNMYWQKDPTETYKVNVMNTLKLLECTKDLPYKALILSGSAAEYGVKDTPMQEDDCVHPTTYYAASKSAATLMAQMYARQYDKPIVVVRLSSIYGEGEDERRFIPNMIRSAVTGAEVPLDSFGKHDWLHVDDAIRAIQVVTEHAEELKGQVINISSGEQFSNIEIVTTIERIMMKNVKAKYTSRRLRPHDSTNWVVDNTKLKSLGWEPQVDLMKGLRRTIQYYKELYESQTAGVVNFV